MPTAAAGVSEPGDAGAAGSPGAEVTRTPDVGLARWSLPRVSLPELIDAAAGAGFHRITVDPSTVLAALRDGWTEDAIRRRLATADLEVTMIDALSNADLPGVPEVGPTQLGPGEHVDAEAGFRAARILRCPRLNLSHYSGDAAVPLRRLAAAVGELCRRAADHGLSICVEFIPGTGIPDLGSALAIVEGCHADNVGIVLDVFHHARSGGPVSDVRSLAPGLITAVQLSDRIAPVQDAPHVPLTGRLLPGDGDLPLAELLDAAMGNNPSATVDIEVLSGEIRSLGPAAAAAVLGEGLRRWIATLPPM